MSRFSKNLSFVLNSARSKANPIVFFGIGNYGSLSSRNSIGIRAVNQFVHKFGMKWVDFPQSCAKLAYSPENHLLFVKADTYLARNNFEVLKRLMILLPNIKTETFCAVHYEHLFKLGIVEGVFGGRTRHNECLHGITSVFQTEKYHRIPIGIAHPIDDISYEPTPYSLGDVYLDTVKPYVLNRFPDVQMELVDKVVVPYAVNEIMQMISKIRSETSQREVTESDIRNELQNFKSPRVDYNNIDTIN
ncbi:hypothetical protein DLAC_00882 [Tieghemostelium lacteum]|uniref:Uncharacterized protein n=1 Tax=Tieghemostelium lacteum TaxID=361077 RepID=A0A152A7H6_TIELA|nr:hypothetical protein DLAC_00882 [Tieghemostelium lacteum]|eukprot:KYR02081.1 hypothetical protein DLAC_00882 [Tieghemostelium lacteum]